MLDARWKRHALALMGMAALAVCTARAQEPKRPAEKIGERLDEAGAAIKRGVGRAGDAVKDQYEKAKGSVQAMGVESRVYGRLHWDKALHDFKIEVTSTRDGVVTLTGAVATAAAKSKAVEVASETVGVSKVIDQMTMAVP